MKDSKAAGWFDEVLYASWADKISQVKGPQHADGYLKKYVQDNL